VYDVVIYPAPNKALAEVLLDGRLGTIVHDYTQKVAHTYATMLGARSSGKEGGLLSTVEANVWPYWGYTRDRWVGEVKVGSAESPYGAADEFGRKNPDRKQNNSRYDGSGQLRDALYMHLPHPI
jgi:hypothetical protein